MLGVTAHNGAFDAEAVVVMAEVKRAIEVALGIANGAVGVFVIVAGEAPAGGDFEEEVGGTVLIGIADAGELRALADEDGVGVVVVDKESGDFVEAAGKAGPGGTVFFEAPNFAIAGSGVDHAVVIEVEAGDIEARFGGRWNGFHRVSGREKLGFGADRSGEEKRNECAHYLGSLRVTVRVSGMESRWSS